MADNRVKQVVFKTKSQQRIVVLLARGAFGLKKGEMTKKLRQLELTPSQLKDIHEKTYRRAMELDTEEANSLAAELRLSLEELGVAV